MKHPFRWIAIAVGRVVGVLAVVLARPSAATRIGSLNTAGRRQAGAGVLGRRARRQAVRSAEPRGQGRARELLELVVHPVPARSTPLSRWYARHKDDPNVAMVGIVRDDTTRRGGLRETTRSTWTSRRPRRKAALDFGTTGQPETYTISPNGVVASFAVGPGASVKSLDQMVAYARGARKCGAGGALDPARRPRGGGDHGTRPGPGAVREWARGAHTPGGVGAPLRRLRRPVGRGQLDVHGHTRRVPTSKSGSRTARATRTSCRCTSTATARPCC